MKDRENSERVATARQAPSLKARISRHLRGPGLAGSGSSPLHLASMDLNYTHEFNGTPAQVAELFRNEAFIDDVAKHAGATEHSVTIDGAVTNLDLTLPAPESIAKFFGKGIKIKQSFSWGSPDADGVHKGTFTVDIVGAPVTVTADATLSPTGEASSRAVYVGELNVKIPLVGKKVEGQVEPMIARAFAGIERRAQAWLAQ